jgi:hypothetical protein
MKGGKYLGYVNEHQLFHNGFAFLLLVAGKLNKKSEDLFDAVTF